ncbi:MAG: hypothetical protein ACJZ69_01895 [Pelagibacteraceae bacterium]
MKKYIFIFFIIVFFAKTGNVFSNNNIFNVDNIKVISEITEKREKILNTAFKKGFKELTNRILLQRDIISIDNISIKEIRKFISSYQIIESDNLDSSNEFIINIVFDRRKLNEFFYQKNISYADIYKTDVVIFPVLVENNNFYLFSENYFYNKWLEEDKNVNNEFINYILPEENIDDIAVINKNRNNLESTKVKNLLMDYDIKNYIFLIIKPNNEKIDIFIKGDISNREVIKNVVVDLDMQNKELDFQKAIRQTKQIISEIWKVQNLIDVRTPSFLNITLDINNQNDLQDLQNALNKIELIENFYVLELNKKYAKIKIKYLGKIDKIQDRLYEMGIKVINTGNNWKLKLI